MEQMLLSLIFPPPAYAILAGDRQFPLAPPSGWRQGTSQLLWICPSLLSIMVQENYCPPERNSFWDESIILSLHDYRALDWICQRISEKSLKDRLQENLIVLIRQFIWEDTILLRSSMLMGVWMRLNNFPLQNTTMNFSCETFYNPIILIPQITIHLIHKICKECNFRDLDCKLILIWLYLLCLRLFPL